MWLKIRAYLYQERFTFFLVALLLALFGPVFFPKGVPTGFTVINKALFLLSGLNLTRNSRILFWALVALFSFLFALLLFDQKDLVQNSIDSGLLSLIFIIYTLSLFAQIIQARKIDTGILIASFSALIIIGLIGARIYIVIENMNPGSFSNLSANYKEDLTYFSFITMFTIGYGDIAPLSSYARSMTILLSLVGHFYSVVIMAIIIGKYLSFKSPDSGKSSS